MNALWTCIAGVVLAAGTVASGAAAPASSQQAGQGATAPAQKPTVKGVAAQPIVSVEGKDSYQAYCAVCHGADAKGNGPAAPAMKTQVPDLTMIAARHGGKFDPLTITDVIRQPGKIATPAHGVDTMPIWGDVFKTEDRARSTLRIKNLVDYLESIQQPARGGGGRH